MPSNLLRITTLLAVMLYLLIQAQCRAMSTKRFSSSSPQAGGTRGSQACDQVSAGAGGDCSSCVQRAIPAILGRIHTQKHDKYYYHVLAAGACHGLLDALGASVEGAHDQTRSTKCFSYR